MQYHVPHCRGNVRQYKGDVCKSNVCRTTCWGKVRLREVEVQLYVRKGLVIFTFQPQHISMPTQGIVKLHPQYCILRLKPLSFAAAGPKMVSKGNQWSDGCFDCKASWHTPTYTHLWLSKASKYLPYLRDGILSTPPSITEQYIH